MPLHFIVSVLPVTIFLGWYNLFMFSLDFFIFSFEYQTPMLWGRCPQQAKQRGKSRQDFSLCGPSVLTPALLAGIIPESE